MAVAESGLYEFLRSFWVIWLIILFAAIVFWIYRPKNKARFEDDARIPFREDDGEQK
jgi:cytochrome c oxidase cbb3-type subunit 4